MKKADHKTDRQQIRDFQQIINVGPATAGDFQRLDLLAPQQLIGRDPFQLYDKICRADNLFHDPCVLDVFIASVDYMNGNPPQPWWNYTKERKAKYADRIQEIRARFAELRASSQT